MFFQCLIILCFSFIDFLSSDIPFSFDFLFPSGYFSSTQPCWVFWHQKVMMSEFSLFLCKWSMRYWLIQCHLWAVIWKWKGRFPTFEGIHYFLLSSFNWLLYKKWELKEFHLFHHHKLYTFYQALCKTKCFTSVYSSSQKPCETT